MPQQQSKTESQHDASLKMLPSAHKKHPLHNLCRGCLKMNLAAKIGFLDFIGLGQFRAGTA